MMNDVYENVYENLCTLTKIYIKSKQSYLNVNEFTGLKKKRKKTRIETETLKGGLQCCSMRWAAGRKASPAAIQIRLNKMMQAFM